MLLGVFSDPYGTSQRRMDSFVRTGPSCSVEEPAVFTNIILNVRITDMRPLSTEESKCSKVLKPGKVCFCVYSSHLDAVRAFVLLLLGTSKPHKPRASLTSDHVNMLTCITTTTCFI